MNEDKQMQGLKELWDKAHEQLKSMSTEMLLLVKQKVDDELKRRELDKK